MFLRDYPTGSITFTFKAMGSRERPPPATCALPERGIGVGLWAADFDGPSRSRVEQLFVPSFGVPRRRVLVRHWCCARLSERLCAAADALHEHVVATPIEVETALHAAHEPDRPDLPLSFRSGSSLMPCTGACAINAWVHWFNFIWTAFARRTSPIAHSHMLSFACSRRVRISGWQAARRFVFSLNGACSAATVGSRHACRRRHDPISHMPCTPKPGNLTFLSLPSTPITLPKLLRACCIFCGAERQRSKPSRDLSPPQPPPIYKVREITPPPTALL